MTNPRLYSAAHFLGQSVMALDNSLNYTLNDTADNWLRIAHVQALQSIAASMLADEPPVYTVHGSEMYKDD